MCVCVQVHFVLNGHLTTGTNAKFATPVAIWVNASGFVTVVDVNKQLLRRISPSGLVTTLAGAATHGYADGVGILLC